jgi:hypothetical protein
MTTTLTVPTHLEGDAGLRPLPWQRMGWVIWRQHRIALAGTAVFLGAVALYVWHAGLQLHHVHAAAAACNPASPVCSDLISRFNSDMNHPLVGGYILQPIPALIGAFLGAPILARELETGTFRYTWTQSFERWRWALAKLVALAVVATAAAGAVSVLFSWYYQPYLTTANQSRSLTESSPFALGLFDLRGISFAAWTLAAFAIGALAGVLIRRVVPAIVATLAAYTGLALVAANLLRQHYLTPLLTKAVNVPGSAWIYSQWWDKDGQFAFTSWRDAPRALVQACAGAAPSVRAFKASPARCFAQHGYIQLTRYQPASRFWPFQWIEGGWLLALSALLIAATVWVVHRRAA